VIPVIQYWVSQVKMVGLLEAISFSSNGVSTMDTPYVDRVNEAELRILVPLDFPMVFLTAWATSFCLAPDSRSRYRDDVCPS
jgi:hypothetical protein